MQTTPESPQLGEKCVWKECKTQWTSPYLQAHTHTLMQMYTHMHTRTYTNRHRQSKVQHGLLWMSSSAIPAMPLTGPAQPVYVGGERAIGTVGLFVQRTRDTSMFR